jgi:hypothetical protein
VTARLTTEPVSAITDSANAIQVAAASLKANYVTTIRPDAAAMIELRARYVRFDITVLLQSVGLGIG